jgi:putative ABC transport system permease protein
LLSGPGYTLFLIGQSFRMAWRMLVANKVRTILTLLGMIIGIGGVVAIFSLSDGLKVSLEEQINNLGRDYLQAKSRTRLIFRGGGDVRRARIRAVNMDEVEAIRDGATEADLVVPVLSFNGGYCKFGNVVEEADFIVTTADWFDLREIEIEKGRRFNSDEVKAARSVIVLGHDLAEKLFPGVDPLDQMIYSGGPRVRVPSQVIGVMKKKGGTYEENIDEMGVVPITVVQRKLLTGKDIHSIFVTAASREQLERAKVQMYDILYRERRVKDPKQIDFEITSKDEIMAENKAQLDIASYIFASIAGVSLLVAGIGIMNIMMVSVTERTREIGLRKALGAKRATILGQFMLEALMLCLIGGALGLGAGYLGGVGLGKLIASTGDGDDNFAPIITALPLMLSFGVSTVIGLIFGIWPAARAAMMDPINALRSE